MSFQLFLVGRHAQQIAERTGFIETLRDLQFAGGIAQPCQDQNLRHHRPGNLFSSGRQRLLQKSDQSHLPAQLEPQPGTAKGPLPFDGDALQIDFYPLRLDVPEQSALSNCGSPCGLLVKAQTPGRIHLPEVGHHALPWASRRAITLDQRPVAMTLAILLSIAATQVHASILRIATSLARGLVFTTKVFPRARPYVARTHTADRKVRESPGSNYFENVFKKCSNHLGLRKLG